MRLAVIALAACASSPGAALTGPTCVRYEPAVVLIESGGWGSCNLHVIVWDDGEVIVDGRRGRLRTGTGAKLARDIADRLRTNPSHESTTFASDQRSVEIMVRRCDRRRAVSVYGMFVLGDTFADTRMFQEPRMFIQALGKLLALEPVAGPTSNRTYTCDDARRDSR